MNTPRHTTPDLNLTPTGLLTWVRANAMSDQEIIDAIRAYGKAYPNLYKVAKARGLKVARATLERG